MIKKTLFIILCLHTTIYPSLAKNLPDPYNSIEVLPFELHGWFSEANKTTLTSFIKNKSPKVIVEIGVWTGKSAIYMAHIMPEDGKLYAVDHFKGQTYYNESNLTPKMKELLPHLYEQFLSNVIHSNLTHKIVPIKLSSLEAAESLDIKVDLVYIDGSHLEEDVFNDICTWHKKLTPESIICGDDYHSAGVRQGVHKAANLLGYQVNSVSNSFWYLY